MGPEAPVTEVLRQVAGAQQRFDAAIEERDELAWLYGRLQRADLPELGPLG